MIKTIIDEFKSHAPFTLFGAATGIAIAAAMLLVGVPSGVYGTLFHIFHPAHVFLGALVTAGVYRLHGKGKLLPTIVIGYVGAVGIGTLGDCLIPYVGEWLLGLPGREVHIGFIEDWYLVNPLAVAGILLAYLRPTTKFPHAGHVLVSTWASLFHMTMAMGATISVATAAALGAFLFLAVWLPCCMGDIFFPLLFTGGAGRCDHHHHHHG